MTLSLQPDYGTSLVTVNGDTITYPPVITEECLDIGRDNEPNPNKKAIKITFMATSEYDSHDLRGYSLYPQKLENEKRRRSTICRRSDFNKNLIKR